MTENRRCLTFGYDMALGYYAIVRSTAKPEILVTRSASMADALATMLEKVLAHIDEIGQVEEQVPEWLICANDEVERALVDVLDGRYEDSAGEQN